MRKILIGLLVIALGLIVVSGFGCTPSKYSSPEKTVETMVEAMKAGDVNAYLDCLTKESKEWLESTAKITGQGLTSESLKTQKMDYDPAKLKISEKKGDTAVMTAEGEPGALVFKREGGNWKIDLAATMQKMFEESSE